MNIPPPPPKPKAPPTIGRAVIQEPTADTVVAAYHWQKRHAKRLEYQRVVNACRNPNNWTRIA